MAWDVEFTHDFGEWWDGLNEAEQESIGTVIKLLEVKGPTLPFPYSSSVEQSRHSHMRELRIQYRGEPCRVLYAFDPRRVAILLLGGNKTGDERWYDVHVPIADELYDVHLAELEGEGLI